MRSLRSISLRNERAFIDRVQIDGDRSLQSDVLHSRTFEARTFTEISASVTTLLKMHSSGVLCILLLVFLLAVNANRVPASESTFHKAESSPLDTLSATFKLSLALSDCLDWPRVTVVTSVDSDPPLSDLHSLLGSAWISPNCCCEELSEMWSSEAMWSQSTISKLCKAIYEGWKFTSSACNITDSSGHGEQDRQICTFLPEMPRWLTTGRMDLHIVHTRFKMKMKQWSLDVQKSVNCFIYCMHLQIRGTEQMIWA